MEFYFDPIFTESELIYLEKKSKNTTAIRDGDFRYEIHDLSSISDCTSPYAVEMYMNLGGDLFRPYGYTRAFKTLDEANLFVYSDIYSRA